MCLCQTQRQTRQNQTPSERHPFPNLNNTKSEIALRMLKIDWLIMIWHSKRSLAGWARLRFFMLALKDRQSMDTIQHVCMCMHRSHMTTELKSTQTCRWSTFAKAASAATLLLPQLKKQIHSVSTIQKNVFWSRFNSRTRCATLDQTFRSCDWRRQRIRHIEHTTQIPRFQHYHFQHIGCPEGGSLSGWLIVRTFQPFPLLTQ